MTGRFAGILILLLLVGCAGQTADPQSAREPEPRPAPLAEESSAGMDDVVELAEAPQTEAAEAEETDKTKVVEVETIGNETAESKAVGTETIVMKVPGMH
jgi:hypothetical protein